MGRFWEPQFVPGHAHRLPQELPAGRRDRHVCRLQVLTAGREQRGPESQAPLSLKDQVRESATCTGETGASQLSAPLGHQLACGQGSRGSPAGNTFPGAPAVPGAPRGADGTAPGEMGLCAQEFGRQRPLYDQKKVTDPSLKPGACTPTQHCTPSSLCSPPARLQLLWPPPFSKLPHPPLRPSLSLTPPPPSPTSVPISVPTPTTLSATPTLVSVCPGPMRAPPTTRLQGRGAGLVP